MFLQSVEDYYIQLVYYLICTGYFIIMAFSAIFIPTPWIPIEILEADEHVY